MKSHIFMTGLALLLLLVGHSSGQISFEEPKFHADVLTTGISQPRDISFGPGGIFGNDLFVISNSDSSGQGYTGSILTVDDNGAKTTWASGLYGPYSIAFSEGGAFGTYLYANCEDAPDGVWRVDPVTRMISSGLATIDEGTGIVLSNTGSFAQYLYASQSKGGGNQNRIYRIGADFQTTVFSTIGADAHMNDLLLSDGGPFGENLYAVARLDPDGDGIARRYVVKIGPNGSPIVLTEGIPSASTFLVISPGGVWSDAIYLASKETIYKVSTDWQISTFATGFSGLAGMDFSPDGSALYVAQSGNGGVVYRIVPEPATLGLLGLGGLALLKRRRES